ncbi:MAG TPA: response regulator [Kofleriaceae bacterium]|nr:response regulator [Kofleriaceae bacterium]
MTIEPERLYAAIEAMDDGFLFADSRTGEVVINAAARRILGIEPDVEVTTRYLKEVVGFYPFELAGSGSVQPVREEIRIGDRTLHSVVTPLTEQGQPIGATVVLRDIEGIRDSSSRRADFARLMSHELRTPLTSIAGALDIVLSGYAGPFSERQHRYVEMARQAATRLNQIVDQLLDLARAQAGTISLTASPVYLDRLTADVIDRYRDSAAARSISLSMTSSATNISLLGDAERLSQVLGNLLVNAIRFAPSGSVIDIEVFGPPLMGDAVGVSVANLGNPIPPDEHERLFEPFSASGRRIGGTALGLSISRTIIEAHGGRIWVESDPRCTKFVFTLPAQDPVAAPAPSTEAPPRRRALGEGSVVMVVDDDARRALLLKGMLMSVGDKVVVATDVDAAMALARQERPALAVVAAAMPHARALLSIFNHDPDTQKMAVLAIGSSSLRTELLDIGADDLLELPVPPAQFRDACLRVIESGRREKPCVLVVDDDASIRAICREVLEVSGYQVCDSASANAALSEAQRSRPNLVLLDVMMPGADGYRAAEMLRGSPAIGMAPIIFLSARGDTADKVRAFRAGAEDYIVKPFDSAELVARVGKALDRQARELGASPTTGLPGVDAIQGEIERRIEQREAAVICYLDLDNLKAFNDYYGYAKANAVIRQTGDVIRAAVAREGGADFVGHIAGDDFVFITTPDHADAMCCGICRSFDEVIPLYYDRVDRARGHIETKDRFGVMRRFPIMTVSIAAISLSPAHSYAGLAELAADGKRIAKSIMGSTYVRDGATIHARNPTADPLAGDLT